MLVNVWSPTGELFEVSPLNAHDLCMNCPEKWSRGPPEVKAKAKTKTEVEVKAEAEVEAEVEIETPEPADMTEKSRSRKRFNT